MDKDKYFSDYDAFTENEMLEITAQGITLKNGMVIDFVECTEVWARENSVEESKCVGRRYCKSQYPLALCGARIRAVGAISRTHLYRAL